MIKKVLLGMALLMTVSMAGCGASESAQGVKAETESTEKEGSGKELYEYGYKAAESLSLKADSEGYEEMYSQPADVKEWLGDNLKNKNFGNPVHIYEVNISGDVFEKLMEVASLELGDTVDLNSFPQGLKDELSGTVMMNIMNIYNSRTGGVYAITASSVYRGTYLVADSSIEKRNVAYIFTYDDTYPVWISFGFGDNGAISVGASLIFDEELKGAEQVEFEKALNQMPQIAGMFEIKKVK